MVKRETYWYSLNSRIMFFYLNSYFIKSIPWMVFPSKSKKVLFSQEDPVPHKSFISEDIQAGSQYTTPSPPPSFTSCEIFIIRSYWPCFENGYPLIGA